MANFWLKTAIVLSSAVFLPALAQDNLGLGNGYLTLRTNNFNVQLVRDAQVLASLKATGETFDFMPYDYLSKRTRNGQYHTGDITFRYRQTGASQWTDGNSASARQPVTSVSTGALAASRMAPTLPGGIPLNITREWVDVSGDLGLQFTIANSGSQSLEIGSLGFPAEFNSIFTDRSAVDIQAKCSLIDPYIGMHAGYIQITPMSGKGSALVVTPLGNTPFEAWRNLVETSYSGTYYGSQTFEGFYEWQVLTKAWAEKEWSGKQPWNTPSSITLAAGQSVKFGLRFSVAKDGVRGIQSAVKNTGTPYAVGIPGYIIPRDLPAQLILSYSSAVNSITTEPAGAFTITKSTSGAYILQSSTTAWGRTKVIVKYEDGKTQTIHYFITVSAHSAVADVGNFATTSQWFTDTSDPFGRAPSPMSYDYETKSIVTQDSRVWIAGLSDEAGAGSFLAATMKQAAQPDEYEVPKLEEFVAKVLWKTIQTTNYGVRKSIFFYEPSAVSGYKYRTDLDWTSWTSWNRASAYGTDRAYDYVHVAAAYWALYRVGRSYPELLTRQKWDWYLNQAYNTALRCVSVTNGQPTVGYSRLGLMGETVFGEILTDLKREGKTTEANNLQSNMQTRAKLWDSQEVPFGSEMSWDSTGQEGVYYWSKYFGYTKTAAKAVSTVLGYMPTVAHWGWNGNARRYWDNIYGGKLQRIERQIHHYGSALNALVVLSEFRSNPTDTYLLRVGYGGMNGPLSNIHLDGFASASFHSWPDTLNWDAYSGDYGPGFVGLILGAGTYVAQDPDAGLVAYGGALSSASNNVTVRTADAVRKKVFIAPLGVLISIDAGIIDQFSYNPSTKAITVVLSQLAGIPSASAAVLWIETTSGSTTYTVKTSGLTQVRQGWQVPLNGNTFVYVQVGPQ